MHARRHALAALVAAGLAACGGDDEPPPPADTFTVSGTVTAAAGQVMDSDTADVRDVPKTRNDTPADAQAVPTPSVVGGWAGVNAAVADVNDWFRITLAAGQSVVLTIADPRADLDLCLLSIADPPVEIFCSDGLTEREVVSADTSGEYYLSVQAWNSLVDASNYVMVVGVSAATSAELTGGGEFVPGEVLVRFRDDLPRVAPANDGDDLRSRAAELGLEPRSGTVRGGPVLLSLGETPALRARALAALGATPQAAGPADDVMDPIAAARRDTRAAVKALRARADVLSADPNYVFRPSAAPTNGFYRYQWHYPLINLPQAWDVTQGNTTVTVAVVDTGVFLEHPDLTGQLVEDGYDFITSAISARDGNGRDPNPNDEGDSATPGGSSWHGTHVAGTVAARWRSDERSAAGVAPGARIMPLRVLGVGGGTSADINEALKYAAGLPNASGTLPARRADIINLSLGCLNCRSATDEAVYGQVRAAGVIVIAAAGNESTTSPGYPASYPGVVSVAAVDLNLAKAPYSNSGSNVDVAAPGGDTRVDRNGDGFADGVLSAAVDDSVAPPVPAWRFYQGTSMAAPHVAGVVALMKSVCPDRLTPARLDELLTSGAITRDLPLAAPDGRDDVFGHGLIDAFAAVQEARRTCDEALPPGVEATPVALDFGTAATTLEVTTRMTGEGALTITGATTTAPWLDVVASAVDASNFGRYAVTISREPLAPGRYGAAVRFTRSDSKTVDVPVTMQVGASSGPGDAGYLYVALVRPGEELTFALLEGRGAGDGVYPFTFTQVPQGRYILFASTDSDEDRTLCDNGEVCGLWPTLGLPSVLDVGADLTGLDFGVGLDLAVGTLGASQAPGPWRLPVQRSLGGDR